MRKKRFTTLLLAFVLALTGIIAVANTDMSTAEAAGQTGVIKASDGNWYYYINGKKQTNYTGVANYKNANGWWYIKKGKVDFSANTVAKNKNGWWYVTGGKVRFGFTGLANYSNKNGWWYIKNGKVDFNAKGVYKNKNGWYYVKNGKVQFSYNGFASNSNGKWYIDKGKVTFKKTGVLKDSTGAIGSKGAWYYVKNSKVQSSYTGVASNSNGTWYIKNGKVDFSYSGTVTDSTHTYTVKNGKVTKTQTCSHNWVATKHEATGHYENVLVQAAYDEKVATGSEFKCKKCGYTTTSGDDINVHCSSCGSGYTVTAIYETVHHDAVYEKQWVQDTAAYTTYKCSKCGATK